MKAYSLFFVLFLASSACSSQTSAIKLYGFKQAVVSGLPPSIQTDEQGNTVPLKSKAHNNFFIYLVYSKNLNLSPVEVWMNGEQYSIKPEAVLTPVEIVYDNGASQTEIVTLIPQTEDTTIQLILSEKKPFKATSIKK